MVGRRIRALDKVGLVGARGINRRGVASSSRPLGSGGGSIDAAEEATEDAHSKLSRRLAMRLRQVQVCGGTNVVAADLAASNGVVSDSASHLDDINCRRELVESVRRFNELVGGLTMSTVAEISKSDEK